MYKILKIDRHTRFTLLYRLWMILAGAVVILAIPYWFDPMEQGYFYTFSSLIAAQVLFELGATFVITQVTAHEIGRSNNVAETASDDNILLKNSLMPVQLQDRLAQILQFANRWLCFAAMLFIFSIGFLGIYFFGIAGDLKLQQWLVPWILLALANAANMPLMGKLALLEGAGQIGDVAKLRLIQNMLGNSAMWILLFSGAKLWALPCLPIIAVVVTFFWLKRHPLIQSLYNQVSQGTAKSMRWKQDIFPMQWRIALSWASGYLIFQAITPIVFAKLGAKAAGQFGLGLAIFTGVQSVGMSWMYTKTPRFAELIARSDHITLNKTFQYTLKLSLSMISLGVVTIWFGLALLTMLHWNIVNRLPSLNVMICLGLVTTVNSLIFSLALYMRCHKEEPMLLSSIVCGVLILIAVYISASYNQFTMTFTYLMITLSVGLPWALILFRSYFYAPYKEEQNG